ncbi:MAG: Cys-Xaa-Xaa-Xaa repeat radical SAM target protein [Prevotella sp.]|nr:Cys-Xaa-Xaa-Xaa repeat radical SAM target protein [Candidatus Prevotella equi]
MNNEELQSRREFFKKAAKGALPMIALATLGPALLSSCDKEETKKSSSSNTCNGCSGSCQSSCSGGCDDACEGVCENGCDRWNK